MQTTAENIEKLRQTFNWLFDLHVAQMALLDLDGVILQTNASWRSFGRENGLDEQYTCIGKNYLDCCELAAAQNDRGARQAYLGLLEVIHTSRPKFTMVYPCHSPYEKRFVRMWVEPQMPEAPVIIVAHYRMARVPLPSLFNFQSLHG